MKKLNDEYILDKIFILVFYFLIMSPILAAVFLGIYGENTCELTSETSLVSKDSNGKVTKEYRYFESSWRDKDGYPNQFANDCVTDLVMKKKSKEAFKR